MKIVCGLILHISVIITMASGSLSDSSEVKEMAISNTEFTLDLLRRCGAEEKGKNVFIAPFSITTALAMTYMGAQGNTAQEMKKVLGWSSDIPKDGFGRYLPLLQEAGGEKAPGYLLAGAQRIYVDGNLSLKPKFISETQKYFASQAQTSNFMGNAEEEREKINSWVSEQTREKIQDLLPQGSVDALTAMVLVQAIYFKGNWEHKFDAKDTRSADFFAPGGKIKVNMMEQTRDFKYGTNVELDCAAVELPYASNSASGKDHDLSMLILLPNDKEGLKKLEADLTHDVLKNIITGDGMYSAKVKLQLPRFSVESSFALKKVLSDLGMPEAFGPQADFSGMVTETNDIKISEVFHKAMVEVNEEGTEAAAATAVVMMERSFPSIYDFIVDHPFLVFITDKRADVILFFGRIINPTPASQAKEEL